jgi:hypothetical protein
MGGCVSKPNDSIEQMPNLPAAPMFENYPHGQASKK